MLKSFFLGFVLLTVSCSTTQKSLTATKNTNMKQSIYFLADNNCREAMEFYHHVFGGNLTITTVGESGAKDFMPASFNDKIINVRLNSDIVDISASDWLLPQRKRTQGNQLCFYLRGGTLNELKTVFDKLSVDGEVTDPLEKQFYGVYGALNDKFGNRWMFITEK